jgi:hypothetical protein
MPKPTPNCIRFSLGEGYMAVEGDYLVFAGTQHRGAADAQCIVIEDPAQTAAVLLELAKTVLEKADEASKRTVLLEAGLLEEVSFRGSSNDLKSLKVSKVKDNNKGEGGGDEAPTTGKLTSTAIKLMSEAGIPADMVRYFGTKEWYVKVLNSSSNPAKAAKTMAAKPKFEGQYQGWLKSNALPAEQPPAEAPGDEQTLEVFRRKIANMKVSEDDGLDPDDGYTFNVDEVEVSGTDGLD